MVRREVLDALLVPLVEDDVALQRRGRIDSDEVRATSKQRLQPTGRMIASADLENARTEWARLGRPPGQRPGRSSGGRHERKL